ncbi:MAG: sugar phosphate nucleotidyltransferase, partial [Candidatus Omnitrophica bacterium]|nr:sugar phosphate nucleotidyltransferase [Candidatus Omnitrophota bacterium]
MPSKNSKGFTALILAGGYATRLYPITLDISKPLLKIDKRTIIDFSIQQLKEIEDAKEIIIVTNDKFYSDYIKWKKKIKAAKKIIILNDKTKTEEAKLGAVGDIYYAIRKINIKNDILVIGGDNIFQRSLSDFINFAEKEAPYVSLGIYDLHSKSLATRYGVVKIDKRNKVLDFQEKPKNPASSLVAMCMYYFPKET